MESKVNVLKYSSEVLVLYFSISIVCYFIFPLNYNLEVDTVP